MTAQLVYLPLCTYVFTLTRQMVYLVFLYDSIPKTMFVSLNINSSINFNANRCVTWNTDLHNYTLRLIMASHGTNVLGMKFLHQIVFQLLGKITE